MSNPHPNPRKERKELACRDCTSRASIGSYDTWQESAKPRRASAGGAAEARGSRDIACSSGTGPGQIKASRGGGGGGEDIVRGDRAFPSGGGGGRGGTNGER